MPTSVFTKEQSTHLGSFIDDFKKAKSSKRTLDYVRNIFKNFEELYPLGEPLEAFVAEHSGRSAEAVDAAWRLKRMSVCQLNHLSAFVPHSHFPEASLLVAY